MNYYFFLHVFLRKTRENLESKKTAYKSIILLSVKSLTRHYDGDKQIIWKYERKIVDK